MKQTVLPRVRGGSSDGRGSQHKPNANGSRSGTSGTLIESHRQHILEHISSHRVTFIQGETGCGKSTGVPQLILDDATARGRRDSVRVLVTQPRRVAAVELARYVAQSRGERIGLDVGFAVSRERASTNGRTRLTFVTSGYLLQWLARDQRAGNITHIVLDEVHDRSLDQDLLLLLLKLLLEGGGNNGRWSSLHKTKLIIMSATMDVRPLQDYFTSLQRAEEGHTVHPIIISGRRFPIEIVHIDEIPGYLGGLPKALEDLATRFVEISGTGVRALDGTTLPWFAIDLIAGLVMQVGRAGDCILVFAATYSDICDIQQGFEKVRRSRDAAAANPGTAVTVPLDVMFLHSMLSREDQKMALAPPLPGTLKVVIATNVAESSLTIPNVRVVFDLGHELQVEYSRSNSAGTASRVWCSKAAARQRAGRAGRLLPGVVIRLYTRETFNNLPEQEKPDIALQNLGTTILRVKTLFQIRFPDLPVVGLLQQLLDSPQPEDVSTSMQELQSLGAITKTSKSESCELTLVGRLATEFAQDIRLARFVLLGVAMGCVVDCVVMAAGISLRDDIFQQPPQANRDKNDPMFLQNRRIANLRARMHFHGGYASNLLVYCQVYCEWARSSSQWKSSQWIRSNELRPSSLESFLLNVRDYAQRAITCVSREFGNNCSVQNELIKLKTLAAFDPMPFKNGRHGPTINPIFCGDIAIVQMAIAGAFSQNWLLGIPAKHLQSVTETRDLEESNMPAHLSFKLSHVPPNLAGPELPKLEAALKVLGPIHKVLPFCERVVLVQCLQFEQKTVFRSPPILFDLPDTARLAGIMAKSFSRNGELVLKTKNKLSPTAEVEELCVGRPSGFRMIKWTIRLGCEVRRVRFHRLNLISRGMEVRKDIPFHIAVAVNLLHSPAAYDIVASNVTILPQDKLFSVLVLLMFRPSGPDGDFQVRILSQSDRIYAIKYQGMTLELAPRFVCMTTLRYIDPLRDRVQAFLAGADHENCNLARDMLNLLAHLQRTEYGVPILAPEVGPWLAYPSLVPARDENAEREEIHRPSKPGFRQPPPPPGSATTSHDTRSCPMLLQSRNDQYPSQPGQANHEESAHLNSPELSDVKLFEQAFQAAELKVNRTLLMEWIGGNKSHNREFFELLQRLLKNPVCAQRECTKAVLRYVYLRLNELVNQKQKKEVEGFYYSICTPDVMGDGLLPSPGAFPSTAAQRVKVVQTQTHKPQVQCQEQREGPAPETNEGDVITRHITVPRQQRDSVITSLQYQSFSRKITFGPFSSSHPELIAVSGKGTDVELAVQGIKEMVDSLMQHSEPWAEDDTYIDSQNMHEKVHCVFADGRQHDASHVTGDESLQFMLVRDNQIGMMRSENSSANCGANSLYHPRMKETFERVLEGLRSPSRNVQIQARLGRAVFGCRRVFKERLPFRDQGQAMPIGHLRKYFDRHQITKRRFDDTIPEKEFYHLRTCLHLCHPNLVERYSNHIIVMSNPAAGEKGNLGALKFKITDALDDPDGFHLQGLERKTRLAVADVVRLHAGAIHVDVRLSMQANDEEPEISEEARDYVRQIVRKGSKLEFPSQPFTIRLQRHKDSERFYFDGFMVTLTNVNQIRGGVSRIKYEAEFEATFSRSELNLQEETVVPWTELTSRIPLLLEQVQNVCSQMACIGPSSTATGVVQALLRSWTAEHNESLLKEILIREFLPTPSKRLWVDENDDQDQISVQICSLIEVLCHCDGRILKEGIDVAAELQLALLHTIRMMNISLSKSMEDRVQRFLSEHKLDPENALEYAGLLKCFCSPLDRNWEWVLQPHLLQLVLENEWDVLERFLSRFSLCHDFFDFSHGQLVDAIRRSSVWTTLSALTRLFHRENVSAFFQLFNVAVTCEETTTPVTSLVRFYVRDLIGLCDTKATSFVGKCLEWTIESQSSIVDWKIHMENVFYVLEMIRTLGILVDENCRSRTLDLLLRLPSSMERKRELEEALLETYGVDETRFRNRHYQRVLQQLGFLHPTHKEELKRRGLDEKRCRDFNFQTWIPGRIRGGRDVEGSSLIPGLSVKGNRLVGSRGIFIPARDPSGQITGGQIKNDDNTSGKRKYVWLSSNKLFEGGKGPQIGGELPLFCCVPRESDTSLVALCEGGLKAHVLAALSGLPVIGASGADFPRSKNLLQSYLVMMNVEQIIFFPDAGSQCNDQVTSNYFQTFRLLRDWRYNVLVAWWGQVNKAEHDDIDDYLVKNNCAIELPLFSTHQFWQLVSLDVRENLQNNFPEYKTAQVFDAVTVTALQSDDTFAGHEFPELLYNNQQVSDAVTFTDDDGITIAKMMERIGSCDYFHMKIPKEVMKRMPPAPNDYVTPQSVQWFTIEVLMARTDDPGRVEAALDWLLRPEGDAKTTIILGLDCEHGFNGDLNLIQISSHQRCVLIRLTATTLSLPQSPRLATILRQKKLVKSGAEVHNDALAIYSTLGLLVNGLKNASPAYKTMNRTAGMLEIFRNLYGWEWTKKKAITKSDWGCATLTLEQIKYAALDAWASRMIVLEGRAATETITSLENLPIELLKLFGRAITNYSILQRTEKTVFETSGNIRESSQSTLRLLQHNFRSRVTSVGSRVELRFNDGQQPALFEARTRTGKSVVLTPSRTAEPGAEMKSSTSSSSKAASRLPIDISSISHVIVDNSRSHHPQLRRLQDLFYDFLCHPAKCPSLLSQALESGRKSEPTIPEQPDLAAPTFNSTNTGRGKAANLTKSESGEPKCAKASTIENLKHGPKPTPPKKPERPALPTGASQLKSKKFEGVFASLNDSQGEALHQILTSPISATIGPPGTGKTRLITALAKAWLHARGEREVLLCTAYQNVAARNLAEALTEEQVPGVLLLVSEDYFVDWHETFYEKLAKSVVVTKTKGEIPRALEDWRTRNKRSSVPILVCTLSLVGSPSFTTSLMAGKVTAMVIDECSQAAEGSCIYPLTCLPDLSLLTVLGDPHQLPPFSGSASGSRPSKVPSVFDLLSNACEVKLLREQYRMPPQICRFISSMIYQNELQTSPKRKEEGDWRHPLLWVDVPGVSTNDPGQTSKHNTAEAQAVLQLCQKLTERYITETNGLVVLTLYEEQNRRVSQLLSREGLEGKVKVHNVDSFQGQQSDIVLISLVAGTRFSPFAADRHRACVMLTRVKRFLCVCGNHEAVRHNPQALLWKSLAEFSAAQGVVVSLKDVETMLAS